MSQALPFIQRPAILDEVSLAGDAGFDPFNLATDKTTLLKYRGAEIRHARLAMLAAVGWPISEILQPWAARLTGMPSTVSSLGGTAPSVLNGGLGQISPIFWIVAIVSTIVIELTAIQREDSGAPPGDLGFDPLNLSSPSMADAELVNGRIAMLAITGFAAQEYAARLTGIPLPVVQETPEFFRPPLGVLDTIAGGLPSSL